MASTSSQEREAVVTEGTAEHKYTYRPDLQLEDFSFACSLRNIHLLYNDMLNNTVVDFL